MNVNNENDNEKEGEDMLAVKKEILNTNNTKYTPAKDEEVLKDIMNFNKKHKKMMEMLSK